MVPKMVNPCCKEETKNFVFESVNILSIGLPYQKHLEGKVLSKTKKEIRIYDREYEIYSYNKIILIAFTVSDPEIPIKFVATVSGTDITLLDVTLNNLKNMGYMNTRAYPIYIHVYGEDNDGNGIPEYGAILYLPIALKNTPIEKIKFLIDNVSNIDVEYMIDVFFEVL